VTAPTRGRLAGEPVAGASASGVPEKAGASGASGALARGRARGPLARHRHSASWRSLHPGAWWLWAGGLAAAAMRTTNVLLLGLIVGVVAVVVAARKSDAPWSRSFATFVRLAIFVVLFRVFLQVLIGDRVPGTTLFTLPSADLPSWMAGMSLGGRVTAEALMGSIQQGMQLAAVLICFGGVNSLCSPYRLLQALPAALYEAGVAVTVALAFAPQAVIELGRIREARRLRGRPVRGVAGLRGLALPVLEGGLERSVALAASMDSRGYGRRAQVSRRAHRMAGATTAVGMMAIAVGLYAVADAGVPGAFGLPLVGLGSVALAVSLFAGGRRAVRTRYRPDPWRIPEWVVGTSGLVALAGMVVAARLPGGSEALDPSTTPLRWPTVPIVAVVGILVALVPAVAAPRPTPSVPPGPVNPSRPSSPNLLTDPAQTGAPRQQARGGGGS
jgi:energy-coupling factor transport system permease protein